MLKKKEKKWFLKKNLRTLQTVDTRGIMSHDCQPTDNNAKSRHRSHGKITSNLVAQLRRSPHCTLGNLGLDTSCSGNSSAALESDRILVITDSLQIHQRSKNLVLQKCHRDHLDVARVHHELRSPICHLKVGQHCLVRMRPVLLLSTTLAVPRL